MSEVEAMPKDKTNTHQGYKYLSETTVKEKIRPLFVKHEVVPMFSAEEKEFIQIGTTTKGGANWLTKVKVTYTFYDVESGESLMGIYEASGADTQDKGVYKAVTGAVKNILMQNFLIPTGDDPEKEGKEPAAKQTYKPANDILPCSDYVFDTMMTTGEFSLSSGISKKTGKPFYIATHKDQKYFLTEAQHSQLQK